MQIINPFPNIKIFDGTKLKTFAEDKSNGPKLTVSLVDRVENYGKGRKSWLPAFSPIPTVFSKAFLTHYHTMMHFDVIRIYCCGRHYEKRRNCL